MNNTLIEAIEKRRTQYALGRNITQAQEEITALIEEAIKLSPSAFNSQSSRAVILFGQQSEKFWRIVMNELHIVGSVRCV